MEIAKGKLREIREQDLENILSWRNSERIRNSMIGDHLISWEEHRRWFERQKDSEDKYLLFEYKGQAAGMVYFTAVDNYHGTCWWGFYLGENDFPRKTGLLMGYIGICHAFSNMAMRKICSQALARNKASLNYHLKLGFKQEGYLYKQVLKQGQYEDIVISGLLADEWNIRQAIIRQEILLNG